MSNPVGAPSKLTDDEKAEVYTALEKYIQNTDDPTIPKFVSSNSTAIKYNVTRDNLNDYPQFSTLIKRAVVKQESYLLSEGGAGKYNPTIAIFRLKQPQHGYTDKTQTDLTTDGKALSTALVSFVGNEPSRDTDTN